jgi:hypothetical protein
MELFGSIESQFADLGPLLLYLIVGANVFVQSALFYPEALFSLARV